MYLSVFRTLCLPESRVYPSWGCQNCPTHERPVRTSLTQWTEQTGEFLRPVPFSRSVYPICLPESGKNFTNTRAFVIGWGTIYFGGPTSNILQEVNLRVWSNQQCATNYNRLNRKVTDTMLCAGERQRDACQGDSGGPLNCLDFRTGKWELCGVVSWGARCAEPDFPGVYTRTTEYLDWIRRNMN